MLLRLDQNNQAVREGMRITFELLRVMNEMCREKHIKFVVAVIPTKEMVFSPYLEHKPKIAHGDVIEKVIQNERLALERTFGFLRAADVAYVDTLPALQAAVGQELYARTAADMHPSKNGYRVIAEAAYTAVQPDMRTEGSASVSGTAAKRRFRE
jgi:hypothetical protein